MNPPDLTPGERQLLEVATAIGPLLGQVAFVGAATTFLHLTDPIRDLRATADVDVVAAVSRADFHRAEVTLRSLGFANDPEVICRFRRGDLVVDFMPVDDRVLGFSNRWFASGFKAAETRTIGGLSIRVLDFPHFVACKLEAFAGRGGGDYLGSKDIEDLVAVFAGRPGFPLDLKDLADPIGAYIRGEFARHLAAPDFLAAIDGQRPRDARSGTRRIIADLREVAGLV